MMNLKPLSIVEWYQMNMKEITFQQDNSKHTKRITQQWFKKNIIAVPDWPSQSQLISIQLNICGLKYPVAWGI